MDPSVILDNSQKSVFHGENTTKEIFVIWSGGCDSTLLIDNLLIELKQKNDKRKVTTISFKHWQVSEQKMLCEENARAAYRHYALINDLPLGLGHTVELPKTSIVCGVNNGSCPQPAMWIANAVPIISDNTLLYAGYIKGDDFFTYNVFFNWCKVLEGLSFLYGKSITPMFPLKFNTKTNIIKQLKDKDILRLTWHCEIPRSDGSECHYCDPCQKHNESLHMVNNDNVNLHTVTK